MCPQNIRSLTPLQRKRRKRRKVVTGLREPQELDLGPLDVEFSLPRFSRLRKAKSAGGVALAEARPDPSPRPSSMETKHRRVKFPRLKVKDAAAAARAGGRLEVGLLKAAVGGKAAEGKGPRFMVPFPKKSKKSREGATAKAGIGLQAPQVELHLPLPKVGPGGGSPEAGAKGKGLPKLEAALPTVGAGGLASPESSPHAGLKLPTAEVAAPKVDLDLDLSLPRREGVAAPPEASLRGKGVRISVEGMEAKLPALEVALGRGKGAGEGLEEPLRLVGTLPALEVEAPSVDLELPLPKGRADVELPKPRLEVKVPAVSLPKLGAQRHQELEGKLPQVELSVGGASESPRTTAPTIPGLGFSLLESKVAVAAGGKTAHLPGVRVPALDLSIPSVAHMQLPRAGVELAAPALAAKAEADVEGPGSRLHVSLPSLPKFDVAAKAVPALAPAREPPPEGEVPVTIHMPRLGLSLPGVKVPRPELDLAVARPAVEVVVPSPRLGFPLAAVPALDIDMPKTGVELGLPRAEGRLEGERKLPPLEALGQELEISIPPCGEGPLESGPSEGVLEVGGVVAKFPKVALALGKEPLGAEAGPDAEGLVAGATVRLPSVEISASGADRAPEPEARLKLPKFALPKFSLSSPKAGRGSAAAEVVAGRGARLRVPTFGISFPRARREVEAEGPRVALSLGGETAAAPALSEQGLRFPSVELPGVGLGLPGVREEHPEEGGLGRDLPDIDLKVPKVSLPRLGARGGDGQEMEAGEAKLRGSWEGLAVGLGATAPKGETTAKVPKFKLPSFGLSRSREVEVGAKSKKPLSKKLVPSKAEAEKGQLHIQAPALPGKVPQVELPKLGSRGAEAGLSEGTESHGLLVKVPVLDLAVPGARADGELATSWPVVCTAEAASGGLEGEWTVLRGPSLGVSAPRVELDISLPTAGPEVSVPQGAVSADSKIRLPKVELPTFGKGQEGGLEAEVQLLGGRRLSFGQEGAREADGDADGSLLGAKIRVPKVDLSLPKARLSEVELPLTEGEGPEGRFKMPTVGLPKFSTPRVKGPEVELGVGLEVGKSKAKLEGSGSCGEGERDLPRLPQLELKAPKLKVAPEALGLEAQSRGLSGLAGSGKSGAEAAMGAEDGRFRLKVPSLSLVKASPELGTDTQPLCPDAEGADFSFRMPPLALPDVGFSVERGSKGEAGALAGLEEDAAGAGIEAMPKGPRLKGLSLGGSGPKGDADTPASSQGVRVPGVELSAPSLKAQAMYDVAGTQLQLEGAGKRGAPGRDGQGSPGGKVGPAEVERKHRVKLPKFGLSLPRAGLEGSDGALGQEAEGRGKRAALVLAWPKGRGAEASSGLLEGDEDRDSRGVMAKLKLRSPFGLSLSKPRMGGEVNGELEEGSPSKLKVPKLGFSKAEGAEEASATLQNGAQDGKATPLGKIRLPQVELSSLAKGSEVDPELSLNLVREEAHSRTGPFSPLKLRAPKLSFSGLKKQNGEAGEAAAPGEKPSRRRFPKLALSPKPHGTPESPSGRGAGAGGEAGGLAIKLPSVGFSEEPGSEGRVLAVGEATAAV